MNTASPQFFKKSDFETASNPDYHSYFNFQKEQSFSIPAQRQFAIYI
jgi:hypothetical protein